MVGTFGYELDVTRIPEADRNEIPGQIEMFKKYNPLIRTGDQYRIGNMFEDNMWDAWMFVAKDKSEAVFTFVQVLGRPNYRSRRIKLKGLDPVKRYTQTSGSPASGPASVRRAAQQRMASGFRQRPLGTMRPPPLQA